MDAFKKVKAGDKKRTSPTASARWINTVSRSAEYYQKNIEGGDGGGNANGLGNSSGLVKVSNLVNDGSPVDLVRGDYVQLGDYLLTSVDHRYHWYEGKLYDSSKKQRIAVLTTAIKGTEIGEARILGRCTARVNVSDTTHRFAKPTDGLHVLDSATSGPVEMLVTPGSTGVQEITVLLGGGGGGGDFAAALGITTASIDAATDIDHPGDSGGGNITIKFKAGDIDDSNWLNYATDGEIASGVTVVAMKIDDKTVIIQAFC